jgi:RNA polymerase sigma factor (sigma-70 family)
MYCLYCGKQLKGTDKFCLYCGAPQKPKEPSKVAASEPTDAPNAVSEQDTSEKNEIILLVQRAMRGDDSVWSDIYEKTHRYVYFMALKFLRSEQDAQDIAQDVYIQIIRSIGQLYSADSFFGWLRSVVYSKCKDFVKKKKPSLLDDIDPEGLENTPEIDETFLPDVVLDSAETRRMILELVDALPYLQRQAVMFYYYDEMTVDQIAALMECSAGTVKSRLNYARLKIKDGVEEHERKGVKLYGMAALPILTILLREQAKNLLIPPSLAGGITSILQQTASSAVSGAVNAAQNAISSPQNTIPSPPQSSIAPPDAPPFTAQPSAGANAGRVVGNVAAKAARKAMPLYAKIVAGIVAAAIVIGGGTTALILNLKPSETSVPAPAKATDDRFIAPIDAPKLDAIEISTAEQFWNIRDNLSGHYVLTNDIDLSTVNGGYWETIGEWYQDSGDDKGQFSGTLDGNGYVIRGFVSRNDPNRETWNCGLLYVNRGIIKNLGIENAVVIAQRAVPMAIDNSISGGFCAQNEGPIYNCWDTGSVTAFSWVTVGGLCGRNYGTIHYSWFGGKLSASDEYSEIGGIAGFVGEHGVVSGCCTFGTVSTLSEGGSLSRSGGIAGHSDGLIENCANYANVTATGKDGRAGGICGQIPNNYGTPIPTQYYPIIRNCLSAGSVHGEHFAGGICSDAYYLGEISGCVVVADSITSSNEFMSTAALYIQDDVPSITLHDNYYLGSISVHMLNAEQITFEQAKSQNLYESIGWSFSDYWSFADSSDYPIIKVTTVTTPPFRAAAIQLPCRLTTLAKRWTN